MYTAFFHLRERPFELTANPRFFFLTDTHRSALVTLWYGITARKGLVALIGDAGTGKTSVIQTVMARLRDEGSDYAYLDNPTLTTTEFRRFVARAFHLGPEAEACKTTLIEALRRRLAESDGDGRPTVFIIDEAQVLPDALLEEIRLLANLETAEAKLLQVILVGQPELAERLDRPGLRQLKQRIAVRVTLDPLGPDDIEALIAGRIRIAGGDPATLFSADGIHAVSEYAAGIPRLVQVICDNALIAACGGGVGLVERAHVVAACAQLDLRATSSRPGAARLQADTVPTPAREPTPEPAVEADQETEPGDATDIDPWLRHRRERPMFSQPEPSRLVRFFSSRVSAP